MKNKRGQFFIIAAIIIITVIISIVTVSNYSQPKQTTKLYDLGQELGIESQQVLDYGTYNELNDTEMQSLMENFIQNYVSYMGGKRNIYFVFGNAQVIDVVGYQELLNESVCITLNPVTHVCGDGTAIAGEGCDVNTSIFGDIGCAGDCQLEQPGCNISAASNETVNESTVNPGEYCDGNNMSGLNCTSFGFDEPASEPQGQTALQCTAQCGFDTSGCVIPQPQNQPECQNLTVLGQPQSPQQFPEENGAISKVAINLAGNQYEFALKPGENFYFVIWETENGEKNVITSPQ